MTRYGRTGACGPFHKVPRTPVGRAGQCEITALCPLSPLVPRWPPGLALLALKAPGDLGPLQDPSST